MKRVINKTQQTGSQTVGGEWDSYKCPFAQTREESKYGTLKKNIGDKVEFCTISFPPRTVLR